MRSPRRRRAKPSCDRPARDMETSSDYETPTGVNRSGTSVRLWFLSLPVLPIILISGVQLQIDLSPAAVGTAFVTALGSVLS